MGGRLAGGDPESWGEQGGETHGKVSRETDRRVKDERTSLSGPPCQRRGVPGMGGARAKEGDLPHSQLAVGPSKSVDIPPQGPKMQSVTLRDMYQDIYRGCWTWCILI